MSKKIIHLIFPRELIKKPVIYSMAKKYKLIPNIRGAKVEEDIGEVTLELSGRKESLGKAEKYLERIGVRFESVVGDIVE